MNKIKALFTTGSGLSLVALFLYFGLKGIETHLTGSPAIDVGFIITILGLMFHPTDMVAGKSVKS